MCAHEGSVNASFEVEDGLQLLQTVADGLRYKCASINFVKLIAI